MGKQKLIAVVGTNASGKSALGLALAQRFDGEILSADSRQVFCGFDLCCGKVTAEERALVPHHLLDVRRIGEPFSVSDYQSECYRLIPEITARGHVPFIVGGTGLYVAAVVRGYDLSGGEPDQELRAKLEDKSIEELRGLLPGDERARLAANPSDWNNKRRLVRCAERALTGGKQRENVPLYDTLQLGLTWPADTLARRIDERLALRLKQGMVDEVRDYLAAGGEPGHLDSLGLEYRYILRYLTGEFKSEREFRDALACAIRRFAKRQMTWFRRDADILWLNATGDYLREAEERVAAFLQNG